MFVDMHEGFMSTTEIVVSITIGRSTFLHATIGSVAFKAENILPLVTLQYELGWHKRDSQGLAHL